MNFRMPLCLLSFFFFFFCFTKIWFNFTGFHHCITLCHHIYTSAFCPLKLSSRSDSPPAYSTTTSSSSSPATTCSSDQRAWQTGRCRAPRPLRPAIPCRTHLRQFRSDRRRSSSTTRWTCSRLQVAVSSGTSPACLALPTPPLAHHRPVFRPPAHLLHACLGAPARPASVNKAWSTCPRPLWPLPYHLGTTPPLRCQNCPPRLTRENSLNPHTLSHSHPYTLSR